MPGIDPEARLPVEPTASDIDRDLELESRILSRYLVDADPPQALVARYVAAHAALADVVSLDTSSLDDPDRKLLAFVRSRPSSLPFLDAATGLLRPASRLRRKIFLMMAILEASPAFAGKFEARGDGAARLVLRFFFLGVSATVRIVLGALLYFGLTRRADASR